MASDSVLLVLAHSRKHEPGVCVAGREVRLQSDPGRYRFGPWVRPVTSHAEGELLPDECRLTCGRSPRPLDFITVPLARPLNDPAQPENWSIRPRVPWREANDRFRPPLLERLVEEPENLWNQQRERRDRVSADYVRKHPPAAGGDAAARANAASASQ